MSPAVRDFLDVVAELLVRDLLAFPEGEVERMPEDQGYTTTRRHEC